MKPPAKPQRFIARMTSAEKTYVMTANSHDFQSPLTSSCDQDCRLVLASYFPFLPVIS